MQWHIQELAHQVALLGFFVLAGEVLSNCLQPDKYVMWLIEKFT